MQQFSIPTDLKDARILVTNDDGIHAAGIHILAQAMRCFSDDVWVVAPETEQSGAGHSLTLHQPLRSREVAHQQFAVSGTPTDCVLLGIRDILPQDKPPALVVSGVNHGDNMAEHVTYSGTIAAAMEGTLMDIPSLAFSRAICTDQPLQWETATQAIKQVITHLVGYSWMKDVLLSVNIPDCTPEELESIKPAIQGRRYGNDSVDARIDPRGRHYYWIGSRDYDPLVHKSDTDCALLQQNHITVTPVSLNLTHHATLNEMHTHLIRSNDAAA